MESDSPEGPKVSDFGHENSQRFDKHFPKGQDEESAVLKAHLIIESMLRDFCCRSLPDPKYLKEARLSYKQISLLARSLLTLPGLEFIWTLVAKLNSLRNMMAHELEPDEEKMERLRSSFLTVITSQKRSESDYSPNDLQGALSYTCGALSALLYVGLAMRNPDFREFEQPEMQKSTAKDGAGLPPTRDG